MQLKISAQLTTEIRETIAAKAPLALARARGTLQFHDVKSRAEGLSADSGIHWILRAYIGTLEKLAIVLPADREPSSSELLAGVRNIFENLVWLKLFLIDPSWGLFFYGQLLKNQQEDLEGMITKFEAEASLFDTLDADDSAIIDQVYEDIGEAEPTEEYIVARSAELEGRKDNLDRRARRAFALYAAAATFNGYGYQAHLIRTQAIPRHRAQLDAIEQRIAAFRQNVGDHDRAERYLGKWNWRGEAQRVQMVEQYDFLYRLTSRLLHATPMNVVTEKELLDGERIALLEYIVVAVIDLLEAVDQLDFPGKIDALYIEPSDLPNGPKG
jgi:hypothetical protein